MKDRKRVPEQKPKSLVFNHIGTLENGTASALCSVEP